MQNPKINYIIIGAAKCGTSALVHILHSHPEIYCFKDGKTNETHYFDKKYRRNNIEYYENLFNVDDKNIKMIGESTPAYSNNLSSIDRIKKYNPDCKIILCMREPIQRAYSHWNMWYKYSLERDPILNFFKVNKGGIKTRGDYFTIIKYLYSNFPKENIHIIVTEQLLNNHDETIKNLLKFLNVKDMKLKQYKSNKGRTNEYKNGNFFDKDSIKYMYDDFFKEQNLKLFDLLGYEINEWNNFYKVNS